MHVDQQFALRVQFVCTDLSPCVFFAHISVYYTSCLALLRRLIVPRLVHIIEMSNDLVWILTKRNNAFLVKRGGRYFSTAPNSATNFSRFAVAVTHCIGFASN